MPCQASFIHAYLVFAAVLGKGKLMKALVCEQLSENLSGVAVQDIPPAACSSGALRLRMHSAAFNYPDLLMTRGSYQYRPDLPFGLGSEGCGTVIEGDVTLLGQRMIVMSRSGVCAQELVVPASSVRPVPGNLTNAEAAGHSITGITAWAGLVARGGLRPGETVLILAAGSGVSIAAIDVAQAHGALVIALASSEAKLAPARARGVHKTYVVPRAGMTAAAFKDMLGGQTVDVVYDPVGGTMSEPALRALAWKGRYLVIGFASGAIPKLALNLPLLKGISIIGVRAGEYARRDPAAGAAHLAAIDDLATRGLMRPHIGISAPLDQATSLLQAMAAGTVTGKAVVLL
jgi:NADPH:quinone reductase